MIAVSSPEFRVLSRANLRWIIRNRAWTWWYLVRYARFVRFRIRHPRIECAGLVFLGRRVTIEQRRGHGRIRIGAWVHIGDDNRIRCHEGTLRIGDKSVLGRDNTINCYMDISIEPETLISDWVYICDFDHRSDDIHTAIRRQGIVKAPVRIGRGSWIGVKASLLRGADIGEHSIVGAHAVVRGAVPPHSVVAGIPARVVRARHPIPPPPEVQEIEAATRAAVEARVARAERAPEGSP